MKYLIYILIIFIFGCGEETKTKTVRVVTPPPPPPEIIEPTIKTLVIYNGAGVGTSDGQYYYHFRSGNIAYAGNGVVAVDDVLYFLDEYGDEISTYRLPCVPSHVTVDGADIWSFETIPPSVAVTMGGMSRTYTRVWLNHTEYGNWSLNQWEVVDDFLTESGDLVIKDTNGAFRPIIGIETIRSASDGGLMLYDINIDGKTAKFRTGAGDVGVSFSMNYFMSSHPWQKSNGVWYSWNGYEFDGSTLGRITTSMQQFITGLPESPVLVSAGTRIEHTETVLYWIECNTGTLYRYTPSLDLVETVADIYNGVGDRQSGVLAAKTINPVMTADTLYYEYEDVIYQYTFDGGLVNSFAAGVKVWGM